jgi:natural product biosynthesis luciferase-like monooxygenase protein
MPDLSVYFFSSVDGGVNTSRYGHVLDVVDLAEELGYTAAWLPERHFHSFGGLFPNPAVVAAALAVRTSRIELRAGSVVLPLHHVARVAEDWAVVDTLSRGRVGLSLATGWNRTDFVLGVCDFADRRKHMLDNIETLRTLWAGGEVFFPDGAGEQIAVRTFPAPHRPELPLWMTATSAPETFVEAGRRGCRLLTAFLQQSPPQLRENIAAYQEAFVPHRPGDQPYVTLMVHAYVGDSAAEAFDAVAGPLMSYQGDFLGLQRRATESPDGGPALSREDQIDLVRYSAHRYAREQGLVGGPAEAAERLAAFAGMGVDEVACLVDFGLDTDRIIGSLRRLADVGRLAG